MKQKLISITLLLSLTLITTVCKKNKPQKNVETPPSSSSKKEEAPSKKGSTYISSQTEKEKYRYVSTKSGLFMRSEASTSGKKLGLIPYAAKVKVLEKKSETQTISGATGKWMKVQYHKQEGWAFGGFLVKTILEEDVMKNLEYLEEAAKEFSNATEKKNYTEAISNYRKALQVRNNSREKAITLFKKSESLLGEIKQSSGDDENSRSKYYLLGDLKFQICKESLKLESCKGKNEKPMEFANANLAISFIKTAIQKKDAVALSNLSGCVLRFGCFCGAGPEVAGAKSAFEEMLKKGDLSSEKMTVADFGAEMKIFESTGISLVIEQNANKKWSFRMVDKIESDYAQCSGTG